jgi:hypothetical protein
MDGGGFQKVETPYELEEPSIAECPVSLISQRSIELVQIVGTIRSVKSSGVTLDLLDMPGHLVDAVRIIERETAAVEAAQDEAVHGT